MVIKKNVVRPEKNLTYAKCIKLLIKDIMITSLV